MYPILPYRSPFPRFPLPIYCKFFYMQTKPLSNNMPTRRVLIEIPHSNNRPIQSTILLRQPHCKRNKVCKIYRHGWRTPRFLSAYIRSRHKLLLHFTKYWVVASTTILFITPTERRLIAEPRELHNDMRVRKHVRDINTLGYKYLYIISRTLKLYRKLKYDCKARKEKWIKKTIFSNEKSYEELV